jgi:ClpP class serine protease
VANWQDVATEIQQLGSPHDIVRRKYLKALSKRTGRNTILYYSGWLQKPLIAAQQPFPFSVNDTDMNGLMTMIHGMDRAKGLDLVLHTPGGDVAATESLVSYLRSMFGTNIRALVPQLAMSAGTMIACACQEIVMGRHSSLGPVDPQMKGLPAHGIVEEFDRAKREVTSAPATIPLWQPIIAKYTPALIGECQKAIKWSRDLVTEWLKTGMFKDTKPNTVREATVKKIIDELGDHALTLSHARHIDLDRAKDLGLKVVELEADDKFQDALLTVHHLCISTLAESNAVKLLANQNGAAFIVAVAMNPVQQGG